MEGLITNQDERWRIQHRCEDINKTKELIVDVGMQQERNYALLNQWDYSGEGERESTSGSTSPRTCLVPKKDHKDLIRKGTHGQ